MKTASRAMAAVALGLLGAACQGPTTPSIPLNELLRAPLTVDINGRQYRLETNLWRDFMPPATPGGSLLAAVVYLTAVDGQPFPDEIDATRLWVVNGEEVWETTFSGGERPRSPSRLDQISKIASGGPRWDVGAEVEVIVRVTVSSMAPRLLRATKQIIGATM